MVTLVNVPRYIALMKNYSSKPMLTKWLGKDGEPVEEGHPLVVIETTKASLEIEAMASGMLFILRKVGERVNIGDTLAMIANSKAEMEAFRMLSVAFLSYLLPSLIKFNLPIISLALTVLMCYRTLSIL